MTAGGTDGDGAVGVGRALFPASGWLCTELLVGAGSGVGGAAPVSRRPQPLSPTADNETATTVTRPYRAAAAVTLLSMTSQLLGTRCTPFTPAPAPGHCNGLPVVPVPIPGPAGRPGPRRQRASAPPSILAWAWPRARTARGYLRCTTKKLTSWLSYSSATPPWLAELTKLHKPASQETGRRCWTAWSPSSWLFSQPMTYRTDRSWRCSTRDGISRRHHVSDLMCEGGGVKVRSPQQR